MSKNLLYWLIAGSRGGENRARILLLLKNRPMNAKRIADSLDLDYKTIQHHLELLQRHGLVENIGGGYGKGYVLSPAMEAMVDELQKLFKNRK